jgi:phage baseplate assembly protein W
MAYPALPHLSFPFQRTADGASITVNEQDTVDEIMACEMVIVSYPVGYREDRPEYGWAFPDLAQAPISTASLEQALKEFEPRGPVQIDAVHDYANSTATLNVNVHIQSEGGSP